MSILILAEHNHKNLHPATLHAVTAALKLDASVTVLIAGSNAESVAEAAAKVVGVTEVLHVDHTAFENFLAENIAPLIAKLAPNYSHIIAPATSNGKNILPRAAGLSDVAQISDVIGINSTDTFIRPIYAGNAIATVKSDDKIKFLTIRPTAFDAAASTGGNATIKKINEGADMGLSKFVSAELSKSERPDLTAARIIVSGGRGTGSAENFKKVLEPLADKMNAAIGASRAAVDLGYAPNDLQVGQTGKVVAPDLYIAVGISGAIQHQAGMKGSKVIVAINNNPDEPIFQIADYGLVADLFVAVPDLTKALS